MAKISCFAFTSCFFEKQKKGSLICFIIFLLYMTLSFNTFVWQSLLFNIDNLT